MKKILILFSILLFSQSFYAQSIAKIRQDDKFGYINEKGEIVIKPSYIKAGDFSDGMAAVFNGEAWGFINTDGEVVISYQFDRVKRFNSGLAVVAANDSWFYIDKKGREVIFDNGSKIFDFHEGLAFFRNDLNLVGVMNAEGEVTTEAKYKEIKPFRNGHAKISIAGRWGLIDREGTVVVEPIYTSVSNYSDVAITARRFDAHGLMIDGEFVEVKDCEKIWDFKDGNSLTPARQKDGPVGYINKEGEWVIKPTYKNARQFSNGLAPVTTKGKQWGYINEEGKMVIEEQYRDAELFSEDGLAPVKLSKLWGFINKDGKLVIDDQYIITAVGFNKTKGFVNGLARVKKAGKWGFIDTDGKVLNGKWYQNAEVFKKL